MGLNKQTQNILWTFYFQPKL